MAALPIFFSLTLIIGTALAYPTGAPESVCDSMLPGHNNSLPQSSPLPNKISLTKQEIKTGEEIEISITGPPPFKGYLLEVRDGDDAVGSFIIPESDPNSRPIDCSGNKNSAATHKNADLKDKVVLKWKAPDTPGNLKVFVTIVREFVIFWARVEVGSITVS